MALSGVRESWPVSTTRRRLRRASGIPQAAPECGIVNMPDCKKACLSFITVHHFAEHGEYPSRKVLNGGILCVTRGGERRQPGRGVGAPTRLRGSRLKVPPRDQGTSARKGKDLTAATARAESFGGSPGGTAGERIKARRPRVNGIPVLSASAALSTTLSGVRPARRLSCYRPNRTVRAASASSLGGWCGRRRTGGRERAPKAPQRGCRVGGPAARARRRQP